MASCVVVSLCSLSPHWSAELRRQKIGLVQTSHRTRRGGWFTSIHLHESDCSLTQLVCPVCALMCVGCEGWNLLDDANCQTAIQWLLVLPGVVDAYNLLWTCVVFNIDIIFFFAWQYAIDWFLQLCRTFSWEVQIQSGGFRDLLLQSWRRFTMI